MKRNDFLKRSALGILGGIALSKLHAKEETDNLYDQVGFNHIPNQTTEHMKNAVIHRANTRGHANHGWLDTNHTFSFANYHNPERMHFGVLRVLNDDKVAPGMGFGTHPHENMEIISIPLEGDLEHKDSMGNTSVIKQGDVQVMSAGTGIYHSEYNKNKDKDVKFLQIWLFPKKKNVEPRYDQMAFKLEDRKNKLQQVLSPNADDEGVWIHQDAWFHLGHFEKDKSSSYSPKRKGNGVYIFVLSGQLDVNGTQLNSRDGMGIWETDKIEFKTSKESEFLVMDVPMSLG